jgi:thioredoxin reductase (NADPH)
MFSWPTPSALDASTQTFLVLTAAQINRARPCGKLRRVERGEVLFQPGDTAVPFFILLSGSMEIGQPGLAGERLITTHGAGMFRGERSMISGRQCLVLGRVSDAGEFLEISADDLHPLVARDAELSEILMRATPPVKRQSSYHRQRARFICWRAREGWRRPCPAT